MNLVLWCIYAAVTLFAIIFSGLREFHMLQLNGYKTPEHSWWMKKNIRRYIPLMIFLVIQLMLLPLERVLTWECEKHVLNYTKLRLAYGITGFLTAANIGIAIANKPGKKFKKPLVYTARVKRMLVTFFILIALIFTGAFFCADRVEYKSAWRFTNVLPFVFTGAALYLTPILVPLSNLINKPIEKSVQKWYINDAKRILREMP